MVKVYRFRVQDAHSGDWIVQLSKATEHRIVQIGGRIIEGTAEDVPEAAIDEDGRHFPVRTLSAI